MPGINSLIQHWNLYWSSMVISLGAFTGGCGIAYSSVAVPNLNSSPNSFHLTPQEESWVVSLYYLGGILGAILIGQLTNKYGRKLSLMVALMPNTLGCLINVASSRPWMMCLGRAVSGMSLGSVLSITAVYIAEISPSSERVILLAFDPVSFGAGFTIMNVLGIFLSWQWLAIASSTISTIGIVVIPFLEESPRWYVLDNRDVAARKALERLRGTKNVDEELQDIRESIQQDKKTAPFFRLLTQKNYYHPFLLTLGIVVFFVCIGLDIVISYSVEIFQSAGLSSLNAYVNAAVLSASGLLGALLCLSTVHYFRRRSILIFSSVMVCLNLFSLGWYFKLYESHQQFCTDYLYWLPLANLLLFKVCGEYGWGGLTFQLIGELLPTQIRGPAASCANLLFSFLTFLVVKLFVDFRSWLGISCVFWLFSCISGISIIFVVLALPETKGRSLEEIEEIFKKNPCTTSI